MEDRHASILFYLVGCSGDWTITAVREPGTGEWTFWARHRDGKGLLHTRTVWEIRECLGMQQPAED